MNLIATADLLGIHSSPSDLTLLQMSLRAAVVMTWGIVIVRLGDRRLLGQNAGFDLLLLVILGSVLSRGVNGQAPFWPTLGASAVLVAFHHVLSLAASHSDAVSRLLKGTPALLVLRGKADRKAMQRAKITPQDLEENLRLNGNVASIAEVQEARLERNGKVSVVRSVP